jgi:hypothetical protein
MRTPHPGPEWVHASHLRNAVRAFSSHDPGPVLAGGKVVRPAGRSTLPPGCGPASTADTRSQPTHSPPGRAVPSRPLTRPDLMGAGTVRSTAVPGGLLTRKKSQELGCSLPPGGLDWVVRLGQPYWVAAGQPAQSPASTWTRLADRPGCRTGGPPNCLGCVPGGRCISCAIRPSPTPPRTAPTCRCCSHGPATPRCAPWSATPAPGPEAIARHLAETDPARRRP